MYQFTCLVQQKDLHGSALTFLTGEKRGGEKTSDFGPEPLLSVLSCCLVWLSHFYRQQAVTDADDNQMVLATVDYMHTSRDGNIIHQHCGTGMQKFLQSDGLEHISGFLNTSYCTLLGFIKSFFICRLF